MNNRNKMPLLLIDHIDRGEGISHVKEEELEESPMEMGFDKLRDRK
jgi:hypothetical protein